MNIIFGEKAKDSSAFSDALSGIKDAYDKKNSDLSFLNRCGQKFTNQSEISKKGLEFLQAVGHMQLTYKDMLVGDNMLKVGAAACFLVMYQINNHYGAAQEQLLQFDKQASPYGKSKLFLALVDLVSLDSAHITDEDIAYINQGIEKLKENTALFTVQTNLFTTLINLQTALNNLPQKMGLKMQ